MLKAWQVGAMVLLGTAMWGFVTWRIGARAVPEGTAAAIGFAAAPLAGWLSVWLAKVAGRLQADQLVPGVMLVGAVAMMLDGWGIRFAPALYRSSDHALAMTGGGLMWAYGVSFAVALVWAAWARRRLAAKP